MDETQFEPSQRGASARQLRGKNRNSSFNKEY